MTRHNILFIIGLTALDSSAQEAKQYPRFITPMDIPVSLSGNFMEPRDNHFHSGLDIRTQGQEGIPVRSVADGWVSRIKISPWGYGKAVYIDHPDGHTSVYGHLQQLKGTVGGACLDAQYRSKEFSIDQYYEKGMVPVKQGEIIALSGNTGGSGGPHLHFELRRSGDQHALDPQALGIKVTDTMQPEIIGIRLYPITDTSLVGPYPARSLGFPAQGGSGSYSLRSGAIPTAFGTVGLAIHTIDRYDGSSAKCGVRRIELYVDSVLSFSVNLDEIDFSTTRYSNAHMDYALFKGNRMDYHRCYRLPNNKLTIYGKEVPQGEIPLEAGKDRKIHFRVTDANGNVSILRFQLHGATANEAKAWETMAPTGSLFRYDTKNQIVEEGVSLTVPALSLYDDTYVQFDRKPAPAKAITPLFILHDQLTPLHSNCSLRIDVPDLAIGIRDKALIVRMDDGGRPSAVGGKYADGALTAQVRQFGNYTVMLDSVPPTISNVDLRSDMKGRNGFTLKIADNLAGIDSWKGQINGDWILMDYEPKSKALNHVFDKHTQANGAKEFKLEVTDDRGNIARFELAFTR